MVTSSVCAECDSLFEYKMRRGGNRRKYCSDVCARANLNSRRKTAECIQCGLGCKPPARLCGSCFKGRRKRDCAVCGAEGTGSRCKDHMYWRRLKCHGCERLFYANRRTDRVGERISCADCRPPVTRARKLPIKVEKPCVVCGVTFIGSPRRVTCGDDCSARNSSSALQSRRIREKYKSDPEFRDKVLASAHARRAEKLGKGGKKILLRYLVERDGGRCRIPECKYRTRQIGGTGGRRPSIDHVVPLSLGGAHELANVQLAHYSCNLAKNNRAVGDQLAMIG